MGTWQMPLKVPPARATLTSRTAAGAASLTRWIQKNPDLLKASNGLRPEIFGKVSISPTLSLNPISFSTSEMSIVILTQSQQGEPFTNSVLSCLVLKQPLRVEGIS